MVKVPRTAKNIQIQLLGIFSTDVQMTAWEVPF